MGTLGGDERQNFEILDEVQKFLSHLEWAFSATQQLHTSRSNPKFISISTFPLADNEPTENLIWVAKLPSQLEFYQMFTRVRQVI